MDTWSSFRLPANNKTTQTTTVHRMPESTAPGMLKSKAQHDRRMGITRTPRQCRDELLDQVSQEIDSARREGIQDTMLAGDFNQDIERNKMRRFINDN